MMFDRLQHETRRSGGPGSSVRPAIGEEQFRALFESAPDAIVVADRDGRIVLANARVEAVFGYAPEELVGQPVEVLIPHALRERHAKHIARYLQCPTPRPIGSGLELTARRKDGVEFPAEISLSPLTIEGGPLVTAVIRDVTERRALEDERRRLQEERAARAAAEAASKAKDQFLASVSHELRTPLSAMLGWTVLVNRNPGNPEVLARALPAIERNLLLQQRLVEELIDVARIVAGTMRVEMRLVDLKSVLQAAIDTVRPAAEAKGIDVCVDVGERSVAILGDFVRLQQVFGNLLSNGVKFTGSGGWVAVRVVARAGTVEVVVEDNGQGISPDSLPHVFERFRQENRAATPSGSGLGLGLSIAADIVERHGGGIFAASEGPGRGSRFTVRLPSVERSPRSNRAGA